MLDLLEFLFRERSIQGTNPEKYLRALTQAGKDSVPGHDPRRLSVLLRGWVGGY